MTDILHEVVSELPEYIEFETWAKERLSETEYKLFVERGASENPDIKSKNLGAYHAWIKDQLITHTQTFDDGTTITISYKDLQKD